MILFSEVNAPAFVQFAKTGSRNRFRKGFIIRLSLIDDLLL